MKLNSHLEECKANDADSQNDMQNVERRVRACDGSLLCDLQPTMVDILTQRDLGKVHEEKEHTANLN